ncbi:MAG: hypothetical protein E7404_02555 [Ruminococcaceae bacterium]|nr:hypothetical protein [Oscillospiraceae bacterium]
MVLFKAKEYLKRNSYIYIIAFIIFAVGIFIGSLASAGVDENQKKELTDFVNAFFLSGGDVSHFNIIKKCVCENFKLVFLCALTSMFIYTMPFCFLTLGFKGFTLGFTSGFILKSFSFKGALFLFSSVLPSVLILLPLMILMCAVCLRFAFLSYKNRTKRQKEIVSFLIIMLFFWFGFNIVDVIQSFISSFAVKGIF